MKFELNEYEFFLEDNNNVIYVYRDNDFISYHFYSDNKEALKIMRDIQSGVRNYEVGTYQNTISKKVRPPRKVKNQTDKGINPNQKILKKIWRTKIRK